MHKPILKRITLSDIPDHGRFGGIRKYDIHTGVDLYCADGDTAYAIESGIIVNIVNFTGSDAGSPWWENTQAVMIEGDSGVILYGEIKPNIFTIGQRISGGQPVGTVKRVLKTDKGLPTTMLHLELYEEGYRGTGEWWVTEKPEQLRNIEEVLELIY